MQDLYHQPVCPYGRGAAGVVHGGSFIADSWQRFVAVASIWVNPMFFSAPHSSEGSATKAYSLDMTIFGGSNRPCLASELGRTHAHGGKAAPQSLGVTPSLSPKPKPQTPGPKP